MGISLYKLLDRKKWQVLTHQNYQRLIMTNSAALMPHSCSTTKDLKLPLKNLTRSSRPQETPLKPTGQHSSPRHLAAPTSENSSLTLSPPVQLPDQQPPVQPPLLKKHQRKKRRKKLKTSIWEVSSEEM